MALGVRLINRIAIEKFQAGTEGSIEKLFPEIDCDSKNDPDFPERNGIKSFKPVLFYEGSPPQDPSRGTAGQITVREKSVDDLDKVRIEAAAGRPSGRRQASLWEVWGHQPPSIFNRVTFGLNKLKQ
jgi:hypothetical protein